MTAAQLDRLAEAHRVAQARLGARTAALAVRLWDLVNLDDIDGSLGPWLAAVEQLVAGQRAISDQTARRFLENHRRLAGVDTALPAVDGAALDAAALRRSLLVTGPYRLRANTAEGVATSQAARMASEASAGVALRQVLAGGRSLVDAAVNADDRIVGVQRRSSGTPCHFCAMLVSRGPVYKSEASASFKAHDRCGCSPEPVYRDRAPLTPQALVEREKWEQAKRLGADNGVRPEVMFRRLHEGRT